MIKVLLADDNKLSLQYFSQLVRWEDYGFQLISKAVDGEEAWRDFQKYHPQVVIADIQMPILSGIQLAEKVLKAAPGTVFLFLSSYKEFQYARAALQLKVYDYLLKHETTQSTMAKKLTEIKTHLKQETAKRQLLAKEEASSLFLKPRCTNPMPENLVFLTGRYDCFFLETEHPLSFASQEFASYLSAKHQPSANTLAEYCGETLPDIQVVIPLECQQFLFITEPQKNPFDFCCQIQRKIKDRFNLLCSIVILLKNQSILECASFYERVCPRLTQIYFYPQGSIIEAPYLMASGQAQTLSVFPHWEADSISHKTLTLLEQQYDFFCVSKNYPSFCTTAQQWLSTLRSYDRRVVDPSSGEIVSLLSPEEIPGGFEVNTMYLFIRKKFEELIRILSLCPIQEFSSQIKEAVYLISQNYHLDSLTVEWIADKLKISTSSLNTLFKRETGFTPWKVIVNTRLHQARLLLEQGISPNRVCALTGYNSLSYFSKAFKKAYGVSPQDWKRRHDL